MHCQAKPCQVGFRRDVPVGVPLDIDKDIEDLFTVEYGKPFNISSVALFLRQTYVK